MAHGGGWQGVVGEGCSVCVKSVRKVPESWAAALAGELKELPNHPEGDELKRLNAAFVCFYVFPLEFTV